ncbi:MAG: succinyldiaminopimelate transaminase [Gammaproteobacteria bacterium]
MNPDLDRLHPYPFQKMAVLHAGITPPADLSRIALSIGEPKHSTPTLITEACSQHLHGLASYPTTRGESALRSTIAHWLQQRFGLQDNSIDPEKHILPVNGTREALFAFAQCIIDRRENPLILMPNPFYQIYEGAAILAGAEPWFMNTTRETDYLPDFDAIPESVWQRCQLLYLCSPGNPTGAVMHTQALQSLLDKADKYDFVIASDECYSEIYFDETSPPPGLLSACQQSGRDKFERCMVFHSLSKRSNAPGLRSGFVAGDATLIEQFFAYRTYHGCAMPPVTQAASIAAWSDEQHVQENRQLYRNKFSAVMDILGPVMNVSLPAASFYLWPETAIDDQHFSQGLLETQNVVVLPGSYLSRETESGNPGKNYVRMALVAPLDDCVEAAWRMRQFVTGD